MSKHIHVNRRELQEFCQRNHIKKLSFFGSVLRDEFEPDSDIDVLVEFEEDRSRGFLGLARMERKLSRLVNNRQVGLRMKNDLSRYFRDDVIASAELQYAQV
jgi:predicted nucleotidyltransferase